MRNKKSKPKTLDLPIVGYKKPRVKSTYFTLGLVLGYLPYFIHLGWLF